MNIKAVIFDLDGTLVDSYPGIAASLNETLREFGREPVDLAEVKRMVGRGVENLIRQAVGDGDLERGVEIFRMNYDRHHIPGTRLMPRVVETLERLRRASIKMAVASNKPSNYTKSIIENLGIGSFFDICYGPDSVGGITKPDPAMLRAIMERLGVTAGETVYVGDMTLDAETARAAGVKLALVSGGGNTFEELRSARPDYLFPKFAALRFD